MEVTAPNYSYPFLEKGGDMGEQTRGYDWSQTIIGAPDQWAPGLQTTVGIVLHATFPLALLWGPERVCFYNDAFRTSVGAGESSPALGKPGLTAWAEIWRLAEAAVEQVMTTGEPACLADQPVTLFRNGSAEETFWTFSFNPVYGTHSPDGTLISCFETTENRRRKQQLEEHRDQLGFAIEAAELATWDLNPATNTFTGNQRLSEWLGLPPGKEINLSTFLDAVVPDDRLRVQEAIQNALLFSFGGQYTLEYTIEPPSGGKRRTVQAKGKIWFGNNQVAYRFAGTLQDITERKQTEQSLLESEVRFRSLIEEAPIATCLFVGPEMRIDIANEVMIGYWKKDRSVIGKCLKDALPEIVDQPFSQILEQVYTTGETYIAQQMPARLEVNGVLKTFFFDFTYKALRNAAGEIYGVVDMAVDVTQQVLIQRDLEESELFSRSIIDNSPVAKLVLVGEQMLVKRVNLNMLAMIGRDESIIGMPIVQVLPELQQTPLIERLNHVRLSGETFYQPEEKIDLIRFGEPYTGYYNYVYKALTNTAGEIYGIIVTATEVTEQVLARQKVEEAETALRRAIEMAELATWEYNVKTATFHYSDRFMGWLGYRESTKGLDEAHNPLPDDYQQRFIDAINAAVAPGSTGIYENEHPIINLQTGQVRIIHAQAQVFYDAAGQPAFLRGTARDITEQRQLQLALEHQVKQRTEELANTNHELAESNTLLVRSNENLQQFAYVASHDLQEPLRKIRSFGDILKTQYADALGEGVNYLDRMQLAANRMSTLIRDLLTYSRVTTRQETSEVVPLASILTSVLTDLELTIQEAGAVIEADPLPTIQGDRSQLGQLFQNLLSNALKFRQPGVTPRIAIRVQQLPVDHLPPGVKPARLSEAYHQIQIVDNGIGFDEKYADRIFQVFQRLHGKSSYAGTGIGLAICEKVVTNHGGVIKAQGQPSRGATFTIYLPV